MKRRYRVEGLTFVTEKEAIREASMVAKTRKYDGDYVLILLEQDYGLCVPHSRVYKNGRLDRYKKSRSGDDRRDDTHERKRTTRRS